MASSSSSVFKTTTSSKSKAIKRIKVTKTIQKTMPDGKVVTETTTEYKEITDDSDFNDDFGTSKDGFADFGKSLGTTSGPFQSLSNEVKDGSSSSSSDEDEENAEAKFVDEALKSHNKYRAKHGVKPLIMDKKLTSYAQEWADKLAREDSFEHRNNQNFGENLYCSWSSNPKAKCPGAKAVDSWYSEVDKYTFGNEPTSTGSGHFTQVVWKDSKTFGIAKARSGSGKIIVVANYEPSGNWLGQYKDNVPPPV